MKGRANRKDVESVPSVMKKQKMKPKINTATKKARRNRGPRYER